MAGQKPSAFWSPGVTSPTNVAAGTAATWGASCVIRQYGQRCNQPRGGRRMPISWVQRSWRWNLSTSTGPKFTYPSAAAADQAHILVAYSDGANVHIPDLDLQGAAVDTRRRRGYASAGIGHGRTRWCSVGYQPRGQQSAFCGLTSPEERSPQSCLGLALCPVAGSFGFPPLLLQLVMPGPYHPAVIAHLSGSSAD